MGIHNIDNHIEVRAEEEDIAMVVAEIFQNGKYTASLMLAEFSEEDKIKKSFPFVLQGKSITEVPHISLTFKDEKQVDKLIKMLETQKEAIREMNAEQGLAKMMEDSE